MQNDMNQVPQGTPVSPNPNYVMPPQPVNTTITVEKKKGNGPKIIIIILAIVVVAVAAYLVYDKVIKKDDKESGEVVENEEEPDDGEVLSDDEALKIGNELLDYAREEYDVIFSEYLKFATADGKYDDEKLVELDDDESGYEITNYDEIMSHYAKGCKHISWDIDDPKAKEESSDCEELLPFVTENGKHYVLAQGISSNILFAYAGDLKIKNKTSNEITYTIDYAYCLTNNDKEDALYYDNFDDTKDEKYKNKCVVSDENGNRTGKLIDPTVYTKDFVIVKEDGSWKIKTYYDDNE